MRYLAAALLVCAGLWASGQTALATGAETTPAAASRTSSVVPLDERSFSSGTRWAPCGAAAEALQVPCSTWYPAVQTVPLRRAPRKCWGGVLAAYLWAASISGTSYADGEASDIDVEFSDLFDKLEYAVMGYGEIRYDRWSFAIDGSVLALKDTNVGPQLGAQLDAELEQTLIDLRLGYTFLRREVGSARWGACCYPRQLHLDAVVGARYWNFEQELTLTTPGGLRRSIDDSEDWWDPYVGARLRWQFAKRWGVTLYGDIGGFDIEDASELTWQVQATLRFYITRQLFLALGYRALGVDRVVGSGATRNGVDATYHGPMLGIGFIF